MLVNGKTTILGNLDLTLLYFSIVKLFHSSALETDQMIVMAVTGEFEYGLPAFEVVALEQACLFELSQHAVYRGQTDVFPLTDQGSINILSREMADRAAFKQTKYSKARQRGLQAHGLKIVRCAHGDIHPLSYLLYHITLGWLWKHVAAMRARILTLFALLWLAGCSSVPSLLYKIEIQQGNVITQEMVDKLKPGMTKSQVRFALGSPMISDAFHENRWDYIYRFDQRGRLVEQRNLTVFFENDQLARIAGSFAMPASFSQLQPVAPAGSAVAADPLPSGSVDAGRQMMEAPEASPAPVSDGGEASGEGSIVSVPPPAADLSASDSALVPHEDVSSIRETSEAAMPKQPNPRLAPSPATDTGLGGADQTKE